MQMSAMRWALTMALAGAFLGCDAGSDDDETNPRFASNEAVLLDFTFHGELETNSTWNVERYIESQVFYTVGQLNGDNSVCRLDKMEVSNIEKVTEDGSTKVTYDVTLPVAWGKPDSVPETYEVILPLAMDYAGQQEFTDEYGHDCVDYGAHDVTPGSMWYYYRPHRYGCDLKPEHVVRTDASITVSEENTSDKYPEYHKIWEDDRLEVVAIFGKDDHDATSNSDVGIRGYNEFVGYMQDMLPGATTVPESVPSKPGVDMPDVTFTAKIDEQHEVQVVALLIDGVQYAGSEFDDRYEALTPTADLVMYFGHSGLGANIRGLANKGEFAEGQYQIYFMNGCDTFAYVDSALSDAHAEVNADDPEGTKYLDMMTDVMPAYFSQMARNGRTMVKALMAYDEPYSYAKIFDGIDDDQVVVVTGEEDNVYAPGFDPNDNGGDDDDGDDDDTDLPWAGFEFSGSVGEAEEFHAETPVVAAGSYLFTLSEDGSNPGGDADLYVRVGAAPTVDEYDCRPYDWGSDEECAVMLESDDGIFVMVRGYADEASHYLLTGKVIE
jgi:hypothetical protein